jgi:hypothetical protein
MLYNLLYSSAKNFSLKSMTETPFAEAAQYWQLEKLYLDLAAAKGRGLTPLEKKFLQGLLCGYSPAEIATQVYSGRSSSAVRVYLSNGLYKYLHELFIHQTGKAEKINNWSRVTHLLEKAGYRQEYSSAARAIEAKSLARTDVLPQLDAPANYQTWDERLDVKGFAGREEELRQLASSIVGDRSRLVSICGMGGAGKTALAVKLVEKIQAEFEVIIWRSLHNPPPPHQMFANLLKAISPERESEPVLTFSQLSDLMEVLRSRRCLLIFNQFESVFAPAELAGTYRNGYQDYGEFLRRLGEERHLSCCLLTSRENPKEFTFLEGRTLEVHSWYLKGVSEPVARQLLTNQEIVGSEAEQQLLVRFYANNPLMIKIAALTIQNFFNRSLKEFLAANTLILGEIRQLLDQQFNRLSASEIQALYLLAAQEQLSDGQKTDRTLSLPLSSAEVLEILDSLQRRSLLHPTSLTALRARQEVSHPLLLLPSLWKTYLLEKFIEQVEGDLKDKMTGAIVKQILWETLVQGRN